MKFNSCTIVEKKTGQAVVEVFLKDPSKHGDEIIHQHNCLPDHYIIDTHTYLCMLNKALKSNQGIGSNILVQIKQKLKTEGNENDK